MAGPVIVIPREVLTYADTMNRFAERLERSGVFRAIEQFQQIAAQLPTVVIEDPPPRRRPRPPTLDQQWEIEEDDGMATAYLRG